MADNNPPASAGTDVPTPLEPTFDEHVEDLSKALQDDPLMADPVEAHEDAPPAAEDPDDDPLGLDAEDVETPDEDDTDGPDDPEVKGGRFAPDSAKVKLDTGETITVADLKVRVDKRVKEFQRGFTEKTQAAAAREAEVNQYAQQVEQFREYASWYAEQFLPKQPAPFTGDRMADPMGYLQWSQKNDEWLTHAQAYQAFQQQKQLGQQQWQGESEKQFNERRQREAEALIKVMPVFKDPAKGKAAWDAMVAGAAEFGYSPEEMNAVVDHRQLVVLREAMAYRRIKAKAPQAQAEAARRPPIREGRRAPADQQQTRQKQSLTERLNRPGNFDAGVELLKNFNI